jgi:hypothetical protein
MDLAQAFGTSKKLEVEGVWKQIGPANEDGTLPRVKVARQGNPAHDKLSRRLMAPHKAALRTGRLPDDVLESIAIKSMSMAILLDWEHLSDGPEKLPPYTPEQGEKLLKKYPDFRDHISAISGDMANYQEEHEAEAGKNSPDSSPGN